MLCRALDGGIVVKNTLWNSDSILFVDGSASSSGTFIDRSNNAFTINRSNANVAWTNLVQRDGRDVISFLGGSLRVAQTSSFNVPPRTLECWFYPFTFSQGGSQFRRIFDLSNTVAPTSKNVLLFLHGTSSVVVYYNGYLIDISGWALNAWNHLALTFSNTEIKLYKNKAFAGSAAVNTNAFTNSGLWLGESQYVPNNGFFSGYMQDIHISSEILY